MKCYNYLFYEYIIWFINLILFGDVFSWYILIIRDFGLVFCRFVNFDLFLMLFIIDNFGGGIYLLYLVVWGIFFVLFYFFFFVEILRNIVILFEIIFYVLLNLIDYIIKSVKSLNSGRFKCEECNDCIVVCCDFLIF